MKMKRMLSLALVLAMFCSLLPSVAGATGKVYGYLQLPNASTNRVVNFRSSANSNGTANVIDKLPEYWVVELLDEFTSGSTHWYKVSCTTTVNTSVQTGYVQADFVKKMTSMQQEEWLSNPTLTYGGSGSSTTGGATGEVGTEIGYLKISVDKVNVRATPEKDGRVLNENNKLRLGEVFPYYAYVKGSNTANSWAQITFDGQRCYVRADCFVFCDAKGNVIKTTPKTTATPAATPVNGVIAKNTLAFINTDKVNFRLAANTSSSTYGMLPLNWMVTVVDSVTVNGTLWYKVKSNTPDKTNTIREGYIMGKYLTGTGKQTTVPVITPKPTSTPKPTATKKTGSGYVLLVLDKVNIRESPAGKVLTTEESDKLPSSMVLNYIEGPIHSDGYDWVKVNYYSITGYIRSDCYIYCDKYGNEVVAPVPTNTNSAKESAGPSTGYVRITAGDVNVRSAPWSTSYGYVQAGDILPAYSSRKDANGQIWYGVWCASLGVNGYVLSEFAVPCTNTGKVVTPKPDTPVTAVPTTVTGYVATKVKSVWIRSAAKTDASTKGQIANANTVLNVVGAPIANGVYSFYPILLSDGTLGYVRSDCVYELAQWQVDYYKAHNVVPTPTPSPRPGMSSYLITTADKLYIRSSPSSKASTRGQFPAAGVVIYFSGTETVGGVTWYRISYNGQTSYLHGNYVRVMSNAEYDAWIAGQQTEAPETTAPVVTPVSDKYLTDVAITTKRSVNLRKGAGMNFGEYVQISKVMTEVKYLGNKVTETTGDHYTWYQVEYKTYIGWLRGDCVRILDADEKVNFYEMGDPDKPREANYSVLSKNMSGAGVLRLQNKLAEYGYLNESNVNGTYDAATETAVRNYQKDKGLTVDGIAGDTTQHTLYNTVPIGYYTSGSVEVVLYPVEMTDWNTGEMNTLWKVGDIAIITDINTGISYRATRIYGSNHVDIQPSTAEDTAAYLKIFGASSVQEVADNEDSWQTWRRRPVWVTIGQRTFAGSMYATPHNFDETDPIPGNNFVGEMCVHFLNSRTHGSNVVDVDNANNDYYGHQSAIQDAYNKSISGNK